MASKECLVHEEDFEYDDDFGVPDLLPDNLDQEQLQSLLDEERDYIEMLQNTTELERGCIPAGNVASPTSRPQGQIAACLNVMECSGSLTSVREEHAREDIVIFLKEFPAQRKEIERCIRCLREMADSIDKMHKKCTIVGIAANSTSASSGILTILGLTLAPITAGGSLVLSATGIGLGAVATATGLSAAIYESVSNSKERKKAQELIDKCGEKLQVAMCPDETDFSSGLSPGNGTVGENVKQLVSTLASQAPDLYKAVKRIKTNVKALKCIRANPGLKALAKQVAATGSATQGTIRGANQVKKVFAGTPLAMAKGARLLSTASAGALLLLDAYNIAQDAKHLTEGAKAEMATELRDRASKLEEELQHLNELYEELKDNM